MGKHPAGNRRAALCAWLTENGINPSDVPQDAEMTISEGTAGRFLNCEVYDRDKDGHIQIDERGQHAATTVVHVPLKTDPPDWWREYVKPTRDELLAGAARVHALHRRNENNGECEYCSARDYPNYAVPWPCDTIHALTGERFVDR
jgi:hypothetical protein